MYINTYLESNMIDLLQYCIEKYIEVCAVQINTGKHLIILLCTYRSPSGNFGEFALRRCLILLYLYKPKLECIICGDFNVNFLIDSSSAQLLTLLYNLIICFTKFSSLQGRPKTSAQLWITSSSITAE